MKARRGFKLQHGAALMVFATMLVLGVTWYAVRALAKTDWTSAQKEARNAAALSAAKQALLAYVVELAAEKDEIYPGRLPCPEPLAAPNDPDKAGIAGPIVGLGNCSNIGRLPWRTLGIEQLKDADGEPLWYATTVGSTGWALQSSSTVLTINPGTTGKLNVDGAANSAVAVIIAPGAPLNLAAQSGTPPSTAIFIPPSTTYTYTCLNVNQQNARYAIPYDPQKFVECGYPLSAPANTNIYTSTGAPSWSNDRVITITAGEVMEAIQGAIADRLQRQIAPWMETWRSTQAAATWGTSYLPHAAVFSDLAANDMCGDRVNGVGATEGLTPSGIAPTGALPNCAGWSSGTTPAKVPGSGSGSLSGTLSCAPQTTTWQCTFNYTGTLTVRMTMTATNLVAAFRSRITAADVSTTNATPTSITVSGTNLSGSDGTTTFTVDLALPTRASTSPVIVNIKHLPDAMLSNTGTRWFAQNGWGRYVYYAFTPSALTVPGAACNYPTNVTGCLTVNNSSDASGIANNKRIVLGLMGAKLTSQSRDCGADTNGNGVTDCSDVFQFLESKSPTIPNRFDLQPLRSGTFNDRLAACPFKYAVQGGTLVQVCP